jgi:surface carbohydrate biosynthesis protein
MTKPHVGLVLDHPKRDLSTVAMLALALTRRGCTASIIPLYEQGVDVPLIGLDAIVTTFARPANRALVERYHNRGIKVFVLDTEGGVLAADGPNAPDRLAATIRDDAWGELLAGYFFWGVILRDAFARERAMPEDRLHLTGCPRFDPVAPQWRAMLGHKRGDFVLVNTAFPVVNSLFTDSGEDREAMLAAGWAPEYISQMIEDSRSVMARMIELIAKLADRFPDKHFVVRPHPFEKHEPYQSALIGRSNLVVDGAGSVLNVIANSICVLQLNCSTAIEALMLDKVPLSPDFISTPLLRAHSPLPNLASQQCHTEAELIGAIERLDETSNGFDFAERYGRLAFPYFHHRDGAAAERMAHVLEKTQPRGQGRNVRESLRSSLDSPSTAQCAQALAANCLGSLGASRLRAYLQPRRLAKRADLTALRALLAAAVKVSQDSMPVVERHRHPLTGLPLASIRVTPAGITKREGL